MMYPLLKIKGYLLIFVFSLINISFAEVPELVVKENSPTHFFSDSEVNLTVNLENIPETKITPSTAWALTAGEAIVSKGRVHEIPAKINFATPQVKRKTELVLCISTDVAGSILQKTIKLYVYPKGQLAELKNILLNKLIGIYDPTDNLSKIFEEYNLRFKKVTTSLEMGVFKGDLLLISEDAILNSRKDICAAIERKLDEGIKVIMLKQNVTFELGKFKFCPQDKSDWISSVWGSPLITSIRQLAVGHPIFSELCSEDLSSWQPDRIVSVTSLEKHEKGNFTILGDDIGKGSLIEELRFPEGRLIICQIPIANRLNIEPVTNILLINLIRYGLSAEPLELKKIRFTPLPEIIEPMKDLGIQNTCLEESNVLLIDISKTGNYQNDELFARGGCQLTNLITIYLEKGNTLLITNLTEDALKYFEDIIPCKLELDEIKIATEKIAVNNESPLMWGIAKEDIDEIIKELQKEGSYIEYALSFKEDDNCKSLIKPGILAKFKKGKGTIIINQIPLIKTENSAYLRTISQLFTNIGVKIDVNG